MKQETPTLVKALKAFYDTHRTPSTAEIGIRLGIPEDYNQPYGSKEIKNTDSL